MAEKDFNSNKQNFDRKCGKQNMEDHFKIKIETRSPSLTCTKTKKELHDDKNSDAIFNGKILNFMIFFCMILLALTFLRFYDFYLAKYFTQKEFQKLHLTKDAPPIPLYDELTYTNTIESVTP